ncbi:hypothetical protein [Mycolicibacterium sphagni]|uniref:hypothetical protein n=1 Tax=Mycolicibacterium sphagni TaxID=1786 RepID=UPI0021F2851B|nr:hypothetical protein [Mycolicibacterium sphagni]MCV7174881.1 hypothetical protein [Mycolicibacterium sphagni]
MSDRTIAVVARLRNHHLLKLTDAEVVQLVIEERVESWRPSMPRPVPQLFIAVAGSKRLVRCRVCGRRGPHTGAQGWQKACYRGHGPCPECGRLSALKKDGTASKCRGKAAHGRTDR